VFLFDVEGHRPHQKNQTLNLLFVATSMWQHHALYLTASIRRQSLQYDDRAINEGLPNAEDKKGGHVWHLSGLCGLKQRFVPVSSRNLHLILSVSPPDMRAIE
jgi:hypothetical protein